MDTETAMSELADNLASSLARVEDGIAAACRAAGRSREEVELVAVSKVHPTAAIVEAVGLGLTLFGENRVQEFAGKSVELAEQGVRGKMRALLIGHLQSNKAAKAVEIFDGIDSLDSLKLAERLNEAGKAGQADAGPRRSQTQLGRNQGRDRSRLGRTG